jgi:para-nitrobenzyl esterase
MHLLRISIILIFTFVLTTLKAQHTLVNSNSSNSDIPKISNKAKFDVHTIKDIVYAKGLQHVSWNSKAATEMDLLLDIYVPDNNATNRPALLLIHGGGFKGGPKRHSKIVSMARYFASRGWVAFSIDYRLRKHKGTVPESWMQYVSKKLAKDNYGHLLRVYPAQRDAKAALRWIVANASQYHINTDYITVGGSSAGAITAVNLGVGNPEDFIKEISVETDPTLETTHRKETYTIASILDFWGSDVALDLLHKIEGKESFDTSDPPILIVHGVKDTVVPFVEAKELRDFYIKTGVPYAYYPCEKYAHGAWNALFDGKTIENLSFDFVTQQQKLKVL